MIAYITGKPMIIDDYLIVKTTSGVGYQVLVTAPMLASVRQTESVELFTYAYIREDKFELYGFLNPSELKVFQLLISVSGCGPKMALGILALGSQNLIKAVQNAQVSFFASCPRVGKKMAQKLIIELKNKLGGLKDLDLSPKTTSYTDASEALVALGFSLETVEMALDQLDATTLTASELVKLALKKLKAGV